MTRRRMWAAALLLVGMLGCAWPGGPPGRPGCPVAPVSSDALPEGLSLRARMSFEVGGRRMAVETVARRNEDELVVVGLANYGVRLFAVRQRGSEMSVESAPSRELAHLGLWVMDALHRAYWIEADEGTRLEPNAEGVLVESWDWRGERVTERRQAGRLWREFSRDAGGSASARVAIEYPPLGAGGERLAGLKIRNPWCGYQAIVSIVQAAPPGAPAGEGGTSVE